MLSRFSVVPASLLLLLATTAYAELTIEQLISEAGLREGPVATRDMDGWRAPAKIVIRSGDEFVDKLRREFPGVSFVAARSTKDAIAEAADTDVIVGFCDGRVVEASKRLQWIQIFSAGAERCLGVDRVGSGDVLLTNMQKMTSPVIGEHAIAMALALNRGLVHYAKSMPGGNWAPDYASESGTGSLRGKTILIAGLGGIGREVAVRAHGLGMRVIATRNSSRSGPDYVDYVGLSDELHELAATADVIVNALPLTPETDGVFDEAFFDAVKPGAIFINVARGKSVVTKTLVDALRDGRVRAAGLDVTDPEPLPADHALWQMDNVIITPHIAWVGSDSEREALVVIENIRRFIAGDALLNVVDPRRGY